MDVFNFTYRNASQGNETQVEEEHESPYKTVEVVFIVLVAGSLSLVTTIGNILVMLSIKVNRNLQTVNNYFLFSLACADLIIGLIVVNFYTVYTVFGYWPLGPVVCDLSLALDYVVNQASVTHLLIISFDRYFCVTKPLIYPIKRTTKMAGMMIAGAWVLSFILWAPAILFWQFIVGERTVPERECYIPFLSNPAVTFCTAIAAFYLPVLIMIVLYVKISKASKSRVKKDIRRPSGPNTAALSPGQGRNNAATPNDDNVPGKSADRCPTQTSDDVANHHDGKLQNGKGPSTAAGEGETEGKDVTRDNSGPGEVKESSNYSTSGSVAASNQKEEEVVPRRGNSSPAHAQSVPCKLQAAPSREKKVTRTIMAILVAFVVTMTPYFVCSLIYTFCSSCIPYSVWTISYWLCYINSTVNPVCYALCNVTFKNTFKHLLLCQYKNIRSAR